MSVSDFPGTGNAGGEPQPLASPERDLAIWWCPLARDAAAMPALVLGFIQEYKAERTLEALKKMLSPTTTVLREGKEEEIPAKDLVPGDILLLEAGDKIPADARLIEVHSLKCDEASLTGESLPVKKDINSLQKDTPISDRKNTVFAGTILTYGRGKAVVTSTGMHTEFGKIAGEVTAADPKKTPLEKRTDEIGKWLGIIAVSLCFIVAGISIVREASGGGPSNSHLRGRQTSTTTASWRSGTPGFSYTPGCAQTKATPSSRD